MSSSFSSFLFRTSAARSPLGDPPLFVGFLRGVDFFWTTQHLLVETLFVVGLVISAFFVLDVYLHLKEEGAPKIKDPSPDSRQHSRRHELPAAGRRHRRDPPVGFMDDRGSVSAYTVSRSRCRTCAT
jgi:Na+/H+ antiporter NhaD/arsenite permease-like protein